MQQVFPRWTNVVFKTMVFGSILALASLMWLCLIYTRSSYGTGVGVRPVQPVPFSHQHHVGVLGIDCRYCHDTVEYSSFAGIPPTKTCMNCHSQMWVGTDMLKPVRDSYRSGDSLTWERVHNLPGFVYFDHSIHVQKGIGCSSCHGQVDSMPYTFQKSSLLMEWCIDCHRNPAREIRPREAVFDMNYRAPPDQLALGRRLMQEYDIHDASFLTSCSVCHR